MNLNEGARTTVALVAATAGWNLLQNRILPRWAYVPANLAGTTAALSLAHRLGLQATDVGTSRARLTVGVATGAAVATPLAAAILAAERSPLLRPLLADDRAKDVSARALLYETAVRIPLGTALFEETLFRGLLLAWLRTRTSATRAVAGSSVLFGAWHILPTWQTMTGYAGGALRSRSTIAARVALGGAVAATGVAGIGFSWLRLRTGSLAAPAILHAAANVAGFVAARRVAGRPT